MINTTVLFYNVGLSDKNLAYDMDALNRILAAGVITDNGQAYELHLTALPFGQVFNISQDVYEKVKTATYILIENRDPEKPNATPDARWCFINNFLQLANGNWSVSYTIDDWASFYLNPNSPYNIHIDGFTERANVPLCVGNVVNTTLSPLTGSNVGAFKRYININREKIDGHGIPLPPGYICAVYFIGIARYNGDPTGIEAHGTVSDFDIEQNVIRKIPRNNSNIFFMVYDTQGYNVPIYGSNSSTGPYTEFIGGGQVKLTQPNDSSIEKIMYFDFIPSDDYDIWDSENRYIKMFGTSADLAKAQLADIYYHPGDRIFYKALALSNFCPLTMANLENIINNNDIWVNGSTFQDPDSIDDYYNRSLYKAVGEYRSIKAKFLTAEIDIPIEFLTRNSRFYIGFSGDGETITCKFISDYTTTTLTNDNNYTATGQNTAYFDLTLVQDFKAYKNAKITGAAGIAATTVGTITALVSSIATKNVPGVIGALSGGAQGIIEGIQKLQGLSPSQQSPANGDFTLTQIINNADLTFVLELSEEVPTRQAAIVKYLEENGAAVSMPFQEYIQHCRMQAFNAIQVAVIDVTGAPQQICRRIEEMFLTGVTLWTATDVGNKRVINYPLVS